MEAEMKRLLMLILLVAVMADSWGSIKARPIKDKQTVKRPVKEAAK
jgi:hypothetical protein